ncbi:MAG: hypothetical protein ACR2RL_21480, partial [Gammaproteobacteria bacterium]
MADALERNDTGRPAPGSASAEPATLVLLAWLPVSALKALVSRLSPEQVNAGITITGMTMLLAPLALWFAWSKLTFCAIFGITV